MADTLTSWLGTAEEAARRSGDLLAQLRTAGVVVTEERGRDVKLEADRRSEDCILEVLQAKSDLTILTEERGLLESGGTSSAYRWIVDPLDGSFNYLRGVPSCCVSIGLWQDDEPVLGAIYDFNRGELFTGAVGIGAWLNKMPIRVSDTGTCEQAVLGTGFPVGMDFSSGELGRFIGHVRQYKKIRMFGSAALSLAYVAAGRTDAYYERDIKLWDVAAGLAIVLGAGGRIMRVTSEKPQTLTVFAGNASLPSQVA